MSSSRTAISRAREVLKIEAQSLLSLISKVNGNFSRAVDLIYQCKGRVIITGIGKSGLIGRKIVATLTSSSTAALAMGDALAIALIDKRKFQEKDFYKFHPGGSLGARLRATVRDAMITGDRIPRVLSGAAARKAIEVIDRMNVGFVLVTDARDQLLGILTDGDVRRIVSRGSTFEGMTIDQVMTSNPKTIDEKASLAETVEFMQKKEITSLAVVNGKKKLKGYVHLHDIFGRGGSVNISLP